MYNFCYWSIAHVVAAESAVATRCKVHCSLLQLPFTWTGLKRVELNPQYAGNFRTGSERFGLALQ